jgi:opacity protein-like surface antigen
VPRLICFNRIPKTGSIIDIVTISNYCRLALILTALAIAGQLQAQIDLPAPDVPVPESGAEDQTEATPSPELPPGGPVQIRPDEGSPLAGTEINAPFDIGRRLQLSASINGGYDDNVLLTPSGSPSWFANPNANLSYQFGSARLAMDLLARGGIIYYFDHPGGLNYEPIVSLDFSLAYKVTLRLTLDFSTSFFYGAQPDLSTAFSSTRRLGNYIRSQNRLSADYKLSPRLTSVSSFFLSALEYESSAASGNDRLDPAFSEQLRYLWQPTTTVSGAYRISLNEAQGGGGESSTQSLVAGLEQSFSPRFHASLHSGVQFRSGNNGDQTSPFVATSLRYELAPIGGYELAAQGGYGLGGLGRTLGRQSANTTYIVWTTSYSIEESDVQTSAGRETFRTNLLLNYAITARISASLGLSYSHGDNGTSNQISSRALGGSSTETTFNITPSVRYAITQRCAVNVGYNYTDVGGRGSNSTALNPLQSFGSYTRNRYFAGITLSF